MRKLIVNTPVTDLRREPISYSGVEEDPLQESQLLFGESLMGKEEKDGWVFVEALEQKKCLPDGFWAGYPGWIRKEHVTEVEEFPTPNLVVKSLWADIYPSSKKESPFHALSMGTFLKGDRISENWWKIRWASEEGFVASEHVKSLSEKETASVLLERGKLFLGFPYLWGGRSPFQEKMATSVDCSGLVNLLYRTMGRHVPRDAHDQFLFSQPVEPHQMRVGDLIFMAKVTRPERMYHVMLYIGDNSVLEANMQSKNVRIISITERLGKPLTDIRRRENCVDNQIFFGRMYTQVDSKIGISGAPNANF